MEFESQVKPVVSALWLHCPFNAIYPSGPHSFMGLTNVCNVFKLQKKSSPIDMRTKRHEKRPENLNL